MYPLANEPTLIVSLGTGSTQEANTPRILPTYRLFRDRFLPRLFRAFKQLLSTIGGEYKFQSRQREGRKERYFRFNIEFNSPKPGLDNTTKMQELKLATQSTIKRSEALDRLSRCIVAKLFIFKLDYVLLKEYRKYIYTRRILYRLRANNTTFSALINQLLKSLARFLL